MKKRTFAAFLVAALLIQVFSVTAFATGEPAFTLTLDASAKSVTVTGEGYAPNQELSIVGYYNVDTGFVNPDYVNQIQADAEGKFIFTYLSSAVWTAGDLVIAKINGTSVSATIASAKSVKITSATPTIVENYAANLVVSVEGVGLSAEDVITVSLLNGETVIASAPAVDGKALLRLTSAPAAGALTYRASAGSLTDTAPLNVVALPADIWAPRIGFKSGLLETPVTFAADVSPSGAYTATVNGVAYQCKQSTNPKVIDIIGVSAKPGDVVKIGKVKYAEFFPSYSFTFTITM